MGIRQQTSDREIDAAIAAEIRKLEAACIRKLCYIGEKAVAHARRLPSPDASAFPNFPKIPPHQPNYIDWTSNLRSSIGYVVAVDGSIVGEGGFKAGRGGDEGARLGRETAMEAAKGFPGCMVLILTAGMEYASYVQDKGYDVLDSAAALAGKLVERLFKMR